MSTLDTMVPLISVPWLDRQGRSLSGRPLPGLRPEIRRELRFSPPYLSSEYRELLGVCTGIAGTELGHVDFTGCWYPEETCPVFQPCLTLTIDEAGRRWICELSAEGLPGRVWCLFSEPEVAVHVSDDLAEFMATLRERSCQGRVFSWLQDLNAQAHAIWTHRRAVALRPYQVAEADPALAAWIATLPTDAYVYDLRVPMPARGWPYGLAGSAGRLFRWGRLPVFAVAGPYSEGSRLRVPDISEVPRVGPAAGGTVIPLPERRRESAPMNAQRRIHREHPLCA